MPGVEAHGRLLHVDGLRGLAAVLVVYQHLLEVAGSLAPADAWVLGHLHWTLENLDLGKLGVVAFFAISGFIIPSSFTGPATRSGFLLSRFFRLYPAFWLSLLLAAVLLPRLGASTFTSGQLLANATMVPTVWAQDDVLGVYWTLTIELGFYGLCFVLFCCGRLYDTQVLIALYAAALVCACIAAVLRANAWVSLPVAAPLYLAIMLFASCLRSATLSGDQRARRYWPAMLAVLLVAAPIVWSTAYTDHSHKESVAASVLAIDAALLLFVFTVRSHAFSSRVFVVLGAISYSIYLFHPLALEVGRALASGLTWPLGGLLLVSTTLGATVAFAFCVYHGLERPAIRFGKRLHRRRSASSSCSSRQNQLPPGRAEEVP